MRGYKPIAELKTADLQKLVRTSQDVSMKVGAQKILDERDDKSFSSSNTFVEVSNYIASFPEGRHLEEADDKLFSLANSFDEIVSYTRILPTGRHIKDADDKYYNKCHEKYYYQKYLELFSQGLHRDEAERKLSEWVTPVPPVPDDSSWLDILSTIICIINTVIFFFMAICLFSISLDCLVAFQDPSYSWWLNLIMLLIGACLSFVGILLSFFPVMLPFVVRFIESEKNKRLTIVHVVMLLVSISFVTYQISKWVEEPGIVVDQHPDTCVCDSCQWIGSYLEFDGLGEKGDSLFRIVQPRIEDTSINYDD